MTQCIDTCLSMYHNKYVLFDKNNLSCLCFQKMNNLFKNNLTDCNLSSLSAIHVYSTGYIKIPKNNNNNNNTQKIDSSKITIRIVFLFTLNGRSIRQIIRLFNTLYNESHYYYFHVDQVIFRFQLLLSNNFKFN